MDQEEAQKQYMEILRSWPGYGSTLFDVEVRSLPFGQGSRVNGRGSRVTSRGSKNSSQLFLSRNQNFVFT